MTKKKSQININLSVELAEGGEIYDLSAIGQTEPYNLLGHKLRVTSS